VTVRGGRALTVMRVLSRAVFPERRLNQLLAARRKYRATEYAPATVECVPG